MRPPSRRSRPAPDGGWGWMVVLGGILANLLLGVIVRAIGVYYLEFEGRFDVSATAVAWIPAVSLGLWNGLGVVTTSLCGRFGCRAVTVAGSGFMATGLILTGLTSSFIATYFTFGLCLGTGLSFVLTPCYVIVNDYFDKRKGVALAVSTFGSSIGAFAGPPLVQLLFKHYGYFGGFLFLGGISLHTLIAAALYRPLQLESDTTGKGVENDSSTKADDVCTKGNKRPFCDCGQLKGYKFLLISLLFAVMSVCLSAEITFLPAMAIDHGMDSGRAVLLLSVFGISDCLFKIPLGHLMDVKGLKQHRSKLYLVFCLIFGVALTLMPLAGSRFWVLAVVCFVGEMAASVMMPQRIMFLGDLFGMESASNALGIQMSFMAVGSLSSRFAGGLLKDHLGTYDPLFYGGGGLMTVMASVLLVILGRGGSRPPGAEDVVVQEMTVCIDENASETQAAKLNRRWDDLETRSVHSEIFCT